MWKSNNCRTRTIEIFLCHHHRHLSVHILLIPQNNFYVREAYFGVTHPDFLLLKEEAATSLPRQRGQCGEMVLPEPRSQSFLEETVTAVGASWWETAHRGPSHGSWSHKKDLAAAGGHTQGRWRSWQSPHLCTTNSLLVSSWQLPLAKLSHKSEEVEAWMKQSIGMGLSEMWSGMGCKPEEQIWRQKCSWPFFNFFSFLQITFLSLVFWLFPNTGCTFMPLLLFL